MWAQDMYMDSSFDKLLKLVNASSLFPCDREAGGCGKLNPTQHFLSSPPHVFITGMWQVVKCYSVLLYNEH